MKVFTAQQMRDFDKAATEEYGIPSIVLMENAALRVVEFLEMKFAPLHEKHIVIVCGKGNNGGDGLAIALHLLAIGCGVQVFLACSPSDLKGDVLTNYKRLEALSMGCSQIKEIDGSEQKMQKWLLSNLPTAPDIVIDALLGTGFGGDINDRRILKALEFLTTAWPNIVAVDIPSGLESDTGKAAAEAVKAHYTVTFAAPKRGIFLRDGMELCGEVWVGDIGAPLGLFGVYTFDHKDTHCDCTTRDEAIRLLPRRSLDAHKGTAGRVVICGGSYGMSGAPTLAAKASLRVGAGLCIACLPDKALPMFASAFAEATSHPLLCDDEGRLIPSAADAVLEYSKGADVLAIGPGLSRSEGALDFARRVICESPLPIVVDADALYALRAIEEKVKDRQARTIITPHPGEMGELMQMSVEEVQNDRLGVAMACAQKFNAIVVLKGPHSIVAIPNLRSRPNEKSDMTFINQTGNPGMATGGSGDVLTGTIAGLLAQTKDAVTATLLGVYLHGLAGDIESSTKGNGLIAGDIADALPHALLELQKPVEPSPNARLRKLE